MKALRYCAALAALCLSATAGAQNYYKIGEQVSLFNDVCRRLNAMYVDTLDAEQMVTDAIDGMTSHMDPYTEFYSAKEKERLSSMLTGKYAGIGAVIKSCLDKKHVCIDYPFDDTPAKEAGFEMGDVILAIDDTTMLDKSVSYVSSHLRGEAGTEARVKIRKRSTGKTVTKTIVRRSIQRPELACAFIDETAGGKVGVIRLMEFTVGCYAKFREAFLELQSQGMQKLVIDLRGNTGGSVSEAVDIASMFVPRGEMIVQTRGKNASLNRKYTTANEPIAADMPLMILVDDESASATEILAGSMQDLDRAKIAGTKTYGKGIVQQTVGLQNDAELKVTVSKYYLPSGRCVQARNYKKGREESVADSLKHTFYTRSGRKVVDGSGIMPDIEAKADTMPRILYYLSVADTLELMHNYVCDYLNNHPRLSGSRDFTLSDKDYADFKKRVTDSSFSYDPFTEKILKELKDVAEKEGYYKNSKAEFEALEKKLKHDLDYDLDFSKAQIKSMLEYHILLGVQGYGTAVAHNYITDSVYQQALKEF